MWTQSLITSYAEYDAFGDRLRALGFSNRWYSPSHGVRDKASAECGLEIRVVTAPYFPGD